ncbi:MAG: AraC family transcriptional regulator [Leucothrix sp.]
MDTISDILDIMKFNGCFYYTTNFSSPWGLEVPSHQNVVRFHIVTSGHCWVKVATDQVESKLSPGDIIVIPHGASHILRDDPETPALELDRATEVSNYQGGDIFAYGGGNELNKTELICGHFEFDPRFTHALINELPDLILINNKESMRFPWLGESIRSLSYETQHQRIGNKAVIKRMSEIIFIHAIRAWSERAEKETGFLLAVSDVKLGKSLQAFHENPAKRWTLADLAQIAGLSRTMFAQRFRDMVGIPVMQYITEWRGQQAQKLLLESPYSIDEIAELTGYSSLAAFSRMFKKLFDVGPGTFRRINKG